MYVCGGGCQVLHVAFWMSTTQEVKGLVQILKLFVEVWSIFRIGSEETQVGEINLM
jgi:hypothetical protein